MIDISSIDTALAAKVSSGEYSERTAEQYRQAFRKLIPSAGGAMVQTRDDPGSTQYRQALTRQDVEIEKTEISEFWKTRRAVVWMVGGLCLYMISIAGGVI